ncbi:MAG: hypothetical protein EOP06_00265 [Proteobacteria bacterium]|nr:MAG: hypothetical protein EOP06_00265 [Pseudomonadota bacterium]
MSESRLRQLTIMGIPLLSFIVAVSAFQNCSNVSFTALEEKGVKLADANEIIRSLQPSLAVRGIGCIQCHASVSSNIITDFGYGNDYFFGNKTVGAGSTWQFGSPYGDHGRNYGTMQLSEVSKFIVPKQTLPAAVQKDSGATTAAEYMKGMLASSSDVGTKQVAVTESNSIHIGAPTEADLITAFDLKPEERTKFFRHSDSSPLLSGLVDRGTFFAANDTLSCDGDVIVRGPLYLRNLSIDSKSGCRIYVIGSVFIYGAVTYINRDPTRNLQISSSSAIALGLGATDKNGVSCEQNRWRTPGNEKSYVRRSSMLTFFTDMWTTPSSYLRSGVDPIENGRRIIAEAVLIESAVGPLYDASCLPEKRDVSFDRILLNAPLVYSRYAGDVRGTIIAEIALMSIGSFKFEYDPVFNEVNVLPYLARSTILDVKSDVKTAK